MPLYPVTPQVQTPSPGGTPSSANQPATAQGGSYLDTLKNYASTIGNTAKSVAGDVGAVRDAAVRSVPFAEKIKAGLASVDDLNPTDPGDKNWRNESVGQRYKQQLQQEQNDAAQEVKQHPISSVVGSVLGTVPQVLAGGAGVDAGIAKLGLKGLGEEAAENIPVVGKLAKTALNGAKTIAKTTVPNVALNAAQGAGEAPPTSSVPAGATLGTIAGVQTSPIAQLLHKLGIPDNAEGLASDAGVDLAEGAFPNTARVIGALGSGAADSIIDNTSNQSTPDSSQKAAAANPTDLSDTDSGSSTPGPVSSDVPNVVMKPDGSKVLISATGQEVPLT